MNRSVRVLLLATALSTASCSYVTEFAVVNLTDTPAEVSYRLRPGAWEPGATSWISPPPATAPAGQLRASHTPWSLLPETSYSWNASLAELTTSLAPGMALRFSSSVNWKGPSTGEDALPVLEVRITTAVDTIVLRSPEDLKRLVRRSKYLYTLTLEASKNGAT